MKNWLLTYFFLTILTCISTYALAISQQPAPVNHTSNPVSGFSKTSILKQVIFSTDDRQQDEKARTVYHRYPGLHFFQYPTVSFVAEANYDLAVGVYGAGATSNSQKSKGSLKDHLLHLFPSHYFW